MKTREEMWWDTYNAALVAFAECGVEIAHASCVRAADRAHGPLEIVVPAGTTFDEAALAKGGKLVSGPGWSQWDAKVEALVKAARRVAANMTLVVDTAAQDDLYTALKPFETESGE